MVSMKCVEIGSYLDRQDTLWRVTSELYSSISTSTRKPYHDIPQLSARSRRGAQAYLFDHENYIKVKSEMVLDTEIERTFNAKIIARFDLIFRSGDLDRVRRSGGNGWAGHSCVKQTLS